MAFERLWQRQDPVALTADGGQDGIVTVDNVSCFKVKQKVVLSSASQPDLVLQVKKVLSITQLIVGPDLARSPEYKNNPNLSKNNMLVKADISAYTVADSATIRAPEQGKSVPKVDDIWKAIYEQEPTVAMRSFLVDKVGRGYTTSNPFPVRLSDGSVNIGSVNAEIEVQLSRIDNSPDAGDVHDSVRIGNQLYEVGYLYDTTELLAGMATNSINKAIDKPWDDLEVTSKTDDGDIETIEARNDGVVVRTLNLEYDSDGDFQRVRKT